MDPRLKQAAQSGSTEALYNLIQENPNVLEEVDHVPFIDTPLHVAVTAGQVSFAMELMNLKPTFAKKLSPAGFSPMHLAVLREQTQMAFELLKIDSSLARVKGREGMTPMHSAVKEGKTDLVAEFLLACPECISDSNANGENALHLAQENERIEVLKVITGWIRRMAQKDARFLEIQVLNKRDYQGNTVLHLAAHNNQLQVISLLLECWALNRNIQNKIGQTALDILENQGQHDNNEGAKMLLRQSGGVTSASLSQTKTLAEFLQLQISFWEYFSTYLSRKRSNMSSESRSALLVVAALIITSAYQTALSPPGGLWQPENINNNNDNNTNTNNSFRRNGKVVMKSQHFYAICFFNTVAFQAALVLTAVVLPGGTYNRLFLWSLLFMFTSYSISMDVISPKKFRYGFPSLFLSCILGFVILFFLILRWKRSVLRKLPEPRSEMTLEGLTTLRLARGAR